jgi:hypothetical protein
VRSRGKRRGGEVREAFKGRRERNVTYNVEGLQNGQLEEVESLVEQEGGAQGLLLNVLRVEGSQEYRIQHVTQGLRVNVFWARENREEGKREGKERRR